MSAVEIFYDLCPLVFFIINKDMVPSRTTYKYFYLDGVLTQSVFKIFSNANKCLFFRWKLLDVVLIVVTNRFVKMEIS